MSEPADYIVLDRIPPHVVVQEITARTADEAEALMSEEGILYARVQSATACTAKIHHGPGHQSSTTCRLTGPHDVHEAIYGSGQQFAQWRDGQYRDQLVEAKIPVPNWVNEGTAMTGFFDEPPQEDE